jgi:hypothetical protein
MDFYRLEPARVVLIDNSRDFGHKDTLDLALPSDTRRGKSRFAAAEPLLPQIASKLSPNEIESLASYLGFVH